MKEDEREDLAIEISDGKVAKKDGRDLKITIDGPNNQKISVTIDVIGSKGKLITVGGASKANSHSHWGEHLGRLIKIAASKGVKVRALYGCQLSTEIN